MIITKTPYRVSFFGGGTDYPVWFREYGGSVLSTTIDKYCYISCRYLPKFFNHNHRFVYSQIENVNTIEEIKHPSIKGTLQWLSWSQGIEVQHMGDLPAHSGLGSSSAFTVGLIHALKALQGIHLSKQELAKSAIHVEQEVIKEAVGQQDQIATSYGGLNRIDFSGDNQFTVKPILLNPNSLEILQDHLMLFFTGKSRFSDKVAKSKISNFSNKKSELMAMQEMVNEAINILTGQNINMHEFGELLHQSWLLKRSLSELVSTPLIDQIYESARKVGAIGGKVLGAGGGGFVLLVVPPEKQLSVKLALKDFTHVQFRFGNSGSSIALNQSNGL